MILGMTGNREGLTKESSDFLINFIKNNNVTEVHHGDCLGCDEDFHEICKLMNVKIIVHPPDKNTMRAFCDGENVTILPGKEYLKRNHDIVKSSDVMIAFPFLRHEILRSGTWATIRFAKKNNKKLFIVHKDGTYEKFE